MALVLTIVYMGITMSPLAPFAMHSKVIAHAVTGECSGDCDICGCSPERRANHTCCCALKKQREQHAHEEGDKEIPECCRKKQDTDKVTILKCNCPCGNSKHAALFGIATTEELLPARGIEHSYSPMEQRLQHNLLPRLASRHSDPPDPPPRLSYIS